MDEPILAHASAYPLDWVQKFGMDLDMEFGIWNSENHVVNSL